MKRTELKRTSSLLRSPFRRTPLARGVSAAPVAGTPRPPEIAPKKRSGGLKPIPVKVREAVKTRADFRCELCRVFGEHLHCHHRRLRSQGGLNEPANLLYVCYTHHNYIHANPELAYEMGWLVKSTDDPALIQVRRLP